MSTVLYLSPSQAAQRAAVTDRCLRRWCARVPGLAVRVVGRWRIDPVTLEKVLRGEMPVVGGEHDTRAR